jgi:hypothetical protein
MPVRLLNDCWIDRSALGYDKLLVMNATLATLKRLNSLLSVVRTFGGSYESSTPTLNAATNEHDAAHMTSTVGTAALR